MSKGFRIRHKTLRAEGAANPVATISVLTRPFLKAVVEEFHLTDDNGDPRYFRSGKPIMRRRKKVDDSGVVLTEPTSKFCPTCQQFHDYKTYHLQLDANGTRLVSAGVLDSLGEAGAVQLVTPGGIAAADPVFDMLGEEDDPPSMNLLQDQANPNDPRVPSLHVNKRESDQAVRHRKARLAERQRLRAEQRLVDPAERSLFVAPGQQFGEIEGAARLYDNYAHLMLGAGTHALPDWDTDNIRACLLDEGDVTLDTTTDQDLADITSGSSIVAESSNLAGAAIATGHVDVDDFTFSSVTGDQSESIHFFHETGTDSTSTMMTADDASTGLPVTPNGGDIDVTVGANGVIDLVS